MNDDGPRVIVISAAALTEILSCRDRGREAVYLVKVDWPELRLTEDQVLTNAAARACGSPMPFPDRSTIQINFRFDSVH